ncbi:hypothetical protein [Haloplanus salilacus]|uniref:hypothetical protein n=1 Tax=Haloplanus salilacus TaxID=2949994 RepID=UPI0030D08F90
MLLPVEFDAGDLKKIINSSDNYEWQKVIQAHVYRLECQLSSSNLRDYHTLSGDQLDAITDSAEWLMTNMSHSDATEKLYQEITGHSAGTGYMYNSILPSSSNLEDWLNDNNVDKPGDDLESCFILCRNFASRAISDIQKGRQETLVDYNSPLKPTLIATGVLLLVGVFTPSLFLLAAPNPILFSPKEIFFIQISILIIVIGATGCLLYIIWNHMKSN